MSPINRLDDFTLLCIFDHLNLEDLINIADLNERYRHLIADHLMIPKFRIHEKEIRLELPYLPSDTPSLIFLNNIGIIQRFLQQFGDLITKLAFNAPQYKATEIEIISQLIIEHCSDNLIEVHLIDVGHQFYETHSTTFPKATKVNIEIHSSIFSGEFQGNLNIHRIYPNVEHFQLKIVSFAPPSIVHNFPKLKSLVLYEVDTMNDDESIVRGLLELNPQLREINVNRQLSLDSLEMISKNSKELHTLSIVYPSNVIQNQTVHFENVTSFAIQLNGYRRNAREQFPIKFTELESLEIFEPGVLKIPLDLIQRHDELKTFKMPLTRCDLGFLSCVHLIDRLPKLIEIQMLWSTEISTQETLDFIGSRGEFLKIYFVMWHKESQEQLMCIIPNDWRIVRTGIAQTLAYEMYEVALRRNSDGF